MRERNTSGGTQLGSSRKERPECLRALNMSDCDGTGHLLLPLDGTSHRLLSDDLSQSAVFMRFVKSSKRRLVCKNTIRTDPEKTV